MKEKLLAVALGMLLVLSPVLAQSASPGIIAPSNPLYFLSVAFDNVRMAIGGADARVNVLEKRAAEAELMAQRGHAKGLNRALREHEKVKEKVEREIAEGKFEQEDREKLQRGLSTSEQKVNMAKQLAPEEADYGLDTALDAQQKGAEEGRQDSQQDAQDRGAEQSEGRRP